MHGVSKVSSASSMELKITEEEDEERGPQQQHLPPPFKDKVLGTSKLQDENKENSLPVAVPPTEANRRPELLRMQSQMALPVVDKSK